MSDVIHELCVYQKARITATFFIFCEEALESNFRLRSTYILKALASTAETKASYQYCIFNTYIFLTNNIL